ncbi:MAG: enoyl-CoA hydratase/isomerase family protein [Burkholderiales bacterium]|nr:enoyl-CoA hydratase/isomerase family protein [Burkholderiales bacterium]
MNAQYRHWRYETDQDRLVWLTFDKAGESTNTFSADAITELNAILQEIRAATPRGLIIRSGKSSGFIAGADIKDFAAAQSVEDGMAIIRRGWDMFHAVAALPFPTVAMVNGFCMGGGVELALACRYRVALDDPKTRFALPEVMLGILPAWGGIKYLPKLVGPTVALDMLLSGKSVDARKAKRIGLVDACVPLRVLENAARMTALEARSPHQPPLMQRLMNTAPFKSVVAAMARKQVAKRAAREHYPAPYVILDLWARYDGDPFAPPLSDPASPAALMQGETVKNLIRIYFLQERMKGLGKAGDFAAKHVHVIGAGVMGGDIAALCAMRGLRVTLQDQNAERLEPAMQRAGKMFRRRLRDQARLRDALDRLVPDVAGDGVKKADLIIEAIFENLEAKRALFARLEKDARPDAILASNTSSLKLADIGANLANPGRLVGIHFFNPVAQMMLVEVVAGANTEPSIANRAAAFVRQLDKLPLPVRDSPGFLVNRVLGPYLNQAFRMVEEGLSAETVDAAATRFGMPMGPIELADTVGLDICIAAGKSLAAASAAAGQPATVPKQLEQLVAAGHLGKKTGRGYYAWREGKAVKGAPGAVPEELIERLIAPYLKEAQAALAEGVVADADLADAGLIFGTGFAPFRGGPLNYLKNRET